MGLKEANIYFDNKINTYYAGQTVNGTIEYVFDNPKKVRGIQVRFKGEAHTEWYDREQPDSDSEGETESTDTAHTANEEYFQLCYYILGSNTGNEIEIPAGKQVYNFTCNLPLMLPSSFEGEFGYVRYTVKVILDRPWKFNQETKMAFTVINALDLNLNPSCRERFLIQMEKTFCCFCCTSAPLSVDVIMPVSGYCPGQVIPVTVHIENMSNVEAEFVKIFLRKIVTYRASDGTTKKTKDIILTFQEPMAPAGAIRIGNSNIQVPPIPPSNLVNCNIIDLDYDFKVEGVVSGMHNDMKAKKNITIGTVPLVGMPGQVGPGRPAQPSASSAPSGEPALGWAMSGEPGPPPYQSLYPTLTKPVYKESEYTARTIRDRGDNKHTMIIRARSFAPYYPTYAAVRPPLPQ